MSNNAAVTADGLEIGRAQAEQAAAARLEPHVDMNPVLLKPQGDRTSQLVLRGRPAGLLHSRDFVDRKRDLWPDAAEALDALRARFDLVVAEGAGSPAEPNLRACDITNMRVATPRTGPARQPRLTSSSCGCRGSRTSTTSIHWRESPACACAGCGTPPSSAVRTSPCCRARNRPLPTSNGCAGRASTGRSGRTLRPGRGAWHLRRLPDARCAARRRGGRRGRARHVDARPRAAARRDALRRDQDDAAGIRRGAGGGRAVGRGRGSAGTRLRDPHGPARRGRRGAPAAQPRRPARRAVSSDGRIAGTYLHGLLHNDGVRAALLRALGRSDGGAARHGVRRAACAAFDRLAAVVREHLDMQRVEALLGR